MCQRFDAGEVHLAYYRGKGVARSIRSDRQAIAYGLALLWASFSNGYDAMGRLNSLNETGAGSLTLVPTAQHDLAGRMTAVQYWAGAANTQETMTYNVNGQLASLN